ncbi:MAG: SEC-C metal-binding domain-containing protein, partial [Actinobacteria bacterium]|nr:SEC-C metal-binding domain-containing protein [Actinomycetota bacterium]
GRSGRQGDPGETRFYLSLEDDLMRLFQGERVNGFLQRFNVPDDVPIEAGMVTKAILSAQTQFEAQNFEIRKNVLKYDEVLNLQRKVVYAERAQLLDGDDVQDQILSFVDDTVAAYIKEATAEGYPEDWDLETLWTALGTLYPVGITLENLIAESGGDVASLDGEYILETVLEDVHKAYESRETELSAPAMRQLERNVVLSVLDRKWREHLYEMDYLQEGIGLRAMAQRDPLVEYQREGYDLFVAMMDSIKEETVGFVFNAEVDVEIATDDNDEPVSLLKGTPAPAASRPLTYSAPSETGEVVAKAAPGSDAFANVGRNDECPCGSGLKYKKCHGSPNQR